MTATPDTYIGLMSGTSLDGVDIALVDFSQHSPRLIHCETRAYSDELQNALREITQTELVTIDRLCQLDITVAKYYAGIVNQTLDNLDISADSIVAIGCHGQTIRHRPDIEPRYTLQIGDPNTLAALTGITTVADFRRRDMALGGQGAPLAPAFHRFLFHSSSVDRAIINIGGIANVTYLPADLGAEIIGFDTGPGNTLLDYWINLHQNIRFDHNGEWAESGQVNEGLLRTMLDEPYFKQLPPKSTGTEYFNPSWLDRYLESTFKAADVQATLIELTTTCIADAIKQLPAQPLQCLVCGGGVHNLQIMKRLATKLENSTLSTTNQIGMDPDYVEAVAFAWLAHETLNQRPGNLPSVTRASAPAILGGIFSGK